MATDDHGAVDSGLGGEANDAAHIHGHLPKATIRTTAVNIACNIVGGGILVLPLAMYKTSLIVGILLLTLMGIMSVSSMAIIMLAAEKTQRFTYKEILRAAFNDKAGKAFEVVVFLYTFGILIVYGRILGDSMPPIMHNFFHVEDDSVLRHGWFWILMAAIVLFPLSSMKQLSELWWSSAVGFGIILYIVAMLLIRFFQGTYTTEMGTKTLVADDVPYFRFATVFFEAIPAISTAFSCHYNVAPYYYELKDRSPIKFFKAMLLCMPLIAGIYLIVGVIGLLMFGVDGPHGVLNSKGDLLNNFSDNDVAFNVGRLAMFLHFVCVYPIICIASRRALNNVLFGDPFQPRHILVIEAFFLVSISCLIAQFAPGVSTVVDINGALFGLSIVCIIPCLFYIKLFKPRGSNGLIDDETAALHKNHVTNDAEVQPQPQWVQRLCNERNTVLYWWSWFTLVFAACGSVISLVVTCRSIHEKYSR